MPDKKKIVLVPTNKPDLEVAIVVADGKFQLKAVVKKEKK